MANICCDDVYFYSTDNPNGLNALWDDLNKTISFNTPLSNGWLGDWFAFKEIPTENIYLRGNIIDMDKNEHSVFIALSTAWTPLYDAYQIIAETYQIHFVLKSIEPGCGIYYNTDLTGDFFPDEYCVTYCNELSGHLRLLKYASYHILFLFRVSPKCHRNLTKYSFFLFYFTLMIFPCPLSDVPLIKKPMILS